MENKEQVKPDEAKANNVKKYDFAHLVVHCGHCNSKYVLEKDVEGGVQINLPTASTSELVLVCKECKNTMALYFVESDGASRKKDRMGVSTPIDDGVVKKLDAVIYEETESGDLEPKMEVVE
jgi:ornithine cyclodeaminase/alanine dehydrogenase-like protein (mu-crystallin family)